MNPENPAEELRARTVEVLISLVDVLPVEELSLLCFHAGIPVEELMPTTTEVRQPLVLDFSRDPF